MLKRMVEFVFVVSVVTVIVFGGLCFTLNHLPQADLLATTKTVIFLVDPATGTYREVLEGKGSNTAYGVSSMLLPRPQPGCQCGKPATVYGGVSNVAPSKDIKVHEPLPSGGFANFLTGHERAGYAVDQYDYSPGGRSNATIGILTDDAFEGDKTLQIHGDKFDRSGRARICIGAGVDSRLVTGVVVAEVDYPNIAHGVDGLGNATQKSGVIQLDEPLPRTYNSGTKVLISIQ